MSNTSSSSDLITEYDLLSLAWHDLTTPGNAVCTTAVLCLFWILSTWLASTLTQNYSQVDKLWSIAPILYVWILVIDARTLLQAIVVTIWGSRLTYNFARRGGYRGCRLFRPWCGDEDYRWKALQEGKFWSILQNKLVWHVFNLVFISIYQNVLLWLIITPAVTAHLVAVHQHGVGGDDNNGASSSSSSSSLQWIDWISASLVILFIMVETIADNQQYAFQTEKHKRLKNPTLEKTPTTTKAFDADYQDGFLQSGLFAIVRKPNYAAEQAIWVSFYGLAVAARGGRRVITSSIVGCILLVLLFLGSGPFTEELTKSKYPAYAEYQQRVPLYVPFLSFGWWKVKRKEN